MKYLATTAGAAAPAGIHWVFEWRVCVCVCGDVDAVFLHTVWHFHGLCLLYYHDSVVEIFNY